MATSGTTAFNLNIDDIIQEGYQRCGLRTNSGYDLRSARTSLNLLFAEWGNRGIHLWKVELNEKSLVSGQAAYTVNADVNDVLEAFISSTLAASDSSSTQDVSLTKIDRSAYAALPNKLSTGTPSHFVSPAEATHGDLGMVKNEDDFDRPRMTQTSRNYLNLAGADVLLNEEEDLRCQLNALGTQ